MNYPIYSSKIGADSLPEASAHREELPSATSPGGEQLARLLSIAPESSPRILWEGEELTSKENFLFGLSHISAELLRRDISPAIREKAFPREKIDSLQYILSHKNPHLDEAFSSLLFRAALPENKDSLLPGDVVLWSRDDDALAQKLWPRAAVLGVGAGADGGAKAALLFDEHPSGEEQNELTSLAMLMKRAVFGKERPGTALFRLLYEVNAIDTYGGAHPKNLANYIKYLNTIPMKTCGGRMDPLWKQATVDGLLAAVYAGIARGNAFTFGREEETALRSSLRRWSRRTQLAREEDFDAVFRKISFYLTTGFSRGMAGGELRLKLRNEKGEVIPARFNGKELEQLLLVPYLPSLAEALWGSQIADFLLFPLWECRVASQLLFEKQLRLLEGEVKRAFHLPYNGDTPAGELTVDVFPFRGEEMTLLWFKGASGESTPAPLNRLLRMRYQGKGLAVFLSPEEGTLMITRGEGFPADAWEKLCYTLAEEEGRTEILRDGKVGAWHLTENPRGLAGFLLNGNPTHRYVPPTGLTPEKLVALAEKL